MPNIVDKTTDALIRQLERLDRLALDNSERVKAECDRATALNNTARNIRELGDLYLRAEMLQMSTPERKFDPGAMFAKPAMVDVNKPNLLRQTANAWGDGAKTVINKYGEFECDDGLDKYYARVPKGFEKEPKEG